MDFTVIIMGRLEFASDRSVQQAINTVEHLLITRYKNDVLYRTTDQIDAEVRAFVAPRQKFTGIAEKTWQNTVHLLTQLTQFSIAGDLHMWKVHDRELKEHQFLEPNSDKTTIRAYQRGRAALIAGNIEEARTDLSLAIKRFERHALALERRGYSYYIEGNHETALVDYNASIEADPKRPEAYLGRARISLDNKDWATAVTDLEQAMKRSMPHHEAYLEALHRKGKCLAELGQYDKALQALNFFLTRPLLKDHPQYAFRRQVAFDKGRVLAANEQPKDAIKSFDEALNMPSRNGKPSNAEILLHRGLAFQQSGQSGYKEDWTKAAAEGSEKAAELLASVN